MKASIYTQIAPDIPTTPKLPPDIPTTPLALKMNRSDMCVLPGFVFACDPNRCI